MFKNGKYVLWPSEAIINGVAFMWMEANMESSNVADTIMRFASLVAESERNVCSGLCAGVANRERESLKTDGWSFAEECMNLIADRNRSAT